MIPLSLWPYRMPRPNLRQIAERVSERHDVPVVKIRSKTRLGPVVKARAHVIQWATDLGYEAPMVGAFLKMHRTSVKHHDRKDDRQWAR